MTAAGYFLLLGAIYVSHETGPAVRTSVGLLSIAIGVFLVMLEVKP